ncbi:MAG: alpha-galactosidase [Clostridiales bacterium]|nr:alpha-galactosidase [Clostridiales bacterium]
MRDKNKAAVTPPMGWNSWDCFGAGVTEKDLLENARYIRDNLKEYGWEYVVCDIQWYEPAADSTHYHKFADLCMDEYSRLIPAENRFPSSKGGRGFSVIASEIHAMGLKFGIHIMRGVPRQAVHRNTPIMCEGVTARDIASDYSICAWNTDMYGIDCRVKGAREYYSSIFKMYADWGVDFVKVDDICNTEYRKDCPYSAKKEIELIREAIDGCGRDMVLSLSPGPATIENGRHLSANANMWRLTGDFWDDWDKLKAMFRRCEIWYKYLSEGCWPDCDMLPLGHLNVNYPKEERYTNFTREEQITLMSLWAVFRSPLMFGGNLPDNDDFTLSLLTNKSITDINQHSTDNRPLVCENDRAVWTCIDKDGHRVLAFFNLSDSDLTISVPAGILDEGKTYKVTDLWTKDEKTCTNAKFSVNLAPHNSKMLTFYE